MRFFSLFFLSLLFISPSLFGQQESKINLQYFGEIGLQFRPMQADFSDMRFAYLQGEQRQRLAETQLGSASLPFLFPYDMQYNLCLNERWLLGASLQSTFSSNFFSGSSLGLGVQQALGSAVYVQAKAFFQFETFGYRIAKHNNEDQPIVLDGRDFRSRQVDLFLGTKRRSFRPLLVLGFRLTELLHLQLKGFYDIALIDQEQFIARSTRWLFPRTARLDMHNPRVELLDGQGNAVLGWRSFENWGLQLSLVFLRGEFERRSR